MKRTLLFVIGSALSVSAFAQTGPQQAIALVPLGSMPVFVVTETSRNVEAVDYQHRSGASEVDLEACSFPSRWAVSADDGWVVALRVPTPATPWDRASSPRCAVSRPERAGSNATVMAMARTPG